MAEAGGGALGPRLGATSCGEAVVCSLAVASVARPSDHATRAPSLAAELSSKVGSVPGAVVGRVAPPPNSEAARSLLSCEDSCRPDPVPRVPLIRGTRTWSRGAPLPSLRGRSPPCGAFSVPSAVAGRVWSTSPGKKLTPSDEDDGLVRGTSSSDDRRALIALEGGLRRRRSSATMPGTELVTEVAEEGRDEHTGTGTPPPPAVPPVAADSSRASKLIPRDGSREPSREGGSPAAGWELMRLSSSAAWLPLSLISRELARRDDGKRGIRSSATMPSTVGAPTAVVGRLSTEAIPQLSAVVGRDGSWLAVPVSNLDRPSLALPHGQDSADAALTVARRLLEPILLLAPTAGVA